MRISNVYINQNCIINTNNKSLELKSCHNEMQADSCQLSELGKIADVSRGKLSFKSLLNPELLKLFPPNVRRDVETLVESHGGKVTEGLLSKIHALIQNHPEVKQIFAKMEEQNIFVKRVVCQGMDLTRVYEIINEQLGSVFCLPSGVHNIGLLLENAAKYGEANVISIQIETLKMLSNQLGKKPESIETPLRDALLEHPLSIASI